MSGTFNDDAVVFVYNKMIIDKSKTINLVKYPISSISKTIDTLFWWNNTDIDRTKINKDLMINFACLSDTDFVNSYLEIAQQRKMDTQTYVDFLTETYKIIKKNNKLPDNDRWIVNYVSKKTDWDDNVNMPIKKWCKWLLI